MTQLPQGASLENLKKQAKTLLREYKSGEAEARSRIHEYFESTTRIGLKRVQLVIARDYGFKSWQALVQRVSQPRSGYLTYELEESLTKAFANASETNTAFLTEEHLILCLLNDKTTVATLDGLSCDVKQLQAYLTSIVDNTKGADGEDIEPVPSIGFQRVVQRAIFDAQISGRKEIDGNDILASFLSNDGPTVNYLHSQGVSRRNLATFLEQGTVAEADLQATRIDLPKLLESLVPEIANGDIEIVKIARMPGQRSKVALRASSEEIDIVSVCENKTSAAFQKDLNGEVVDFFVWTDDLITNLHRALEPLTVVSAEIDDRFVVSDALNAEAYRKEGKVPVGRVVVNVGTSHSKNDLINDPVVDLAKQLCGCDIQFLF